MSFKAGFWPIILMSAAVPVDAQPVINSGGVVNAASYAYSGLPNSSIAQGSMFLVFGTGLGPSSLVQNKSYPIPTNLGGTSARINVEGITVGGLMVYATAGQLAVILPSSTPVGSGTITVTYNGATSAPKPIQVIESSFGAFARNQAGSGPGVITDAHYRMFEMTSAARPGDPAILWGTGLGAVPFDDAQPPEAKDLKSVPVEVFVGEKAAKLYYRGRSGCCSALDQIIFYVPSGAEGCHVPVVVKIGIVVSNTISMPITTASNRVCSDAGGFSASDLENLLAKPEMNIASINLTRVSMSMSGLPGMEAIDTMTDSGEAEFARYTAAQFKTSQGLLLPTSIGACVAYQFSGNDTGLVDPIQPKMLDAGPVIHVNGPMGLMDLTKEEGAYSAMLGGRGVPGMPAPYLEPGLYQIANAAGGADVKSFNVLFTLHQNFTWTNKSEISSIARIFQITVNWSGGDPSSLAVIMGSSSISGIKPVGAGFLCLAPISAGSFTIPKEVLLALPVSGTDSETGAPLGYLMVGTGTAPVKFAAPGLDIGYVLSLVMSGKNVFYRIGP